MLTEPKEDFSIKFIILSLVQLSFFFGVIVQLSCVLDPKKKIIYSHQKHWVNKEKKSKESVAIWKRKSFILTKSIGLAKEKKTKASRRQREKNSYDDLFMKTHIVIWNILYLDHENSFFFLFFLNLIPVGQLMVSTIPSCFTYNCPHSLLSGQVHA